MAKRNRAIGKPRSRKIRSNSSDQKSEMHAQPQGCAFFYGRIRSSQAAGDELIFPLSMAFNRIVRLV